MCSGSSVTFFLSLSLSLARAHTHTRTDTDTCSDTNTCSDTHLHALPTPRLSVRENLDKPGT